MTHCTPSCRVLLFGQLRASTEKTQGRAGPPDLAAPLAAQLTHWQAEDKARLEADHVQGALRRPSQVRAPLPPWSTPSPARSRGATDAACAPAEAHFARQGNDGSLPVQRTFHCDSWIPVLLISARASSMSKNFRVKPWRSEFPDCLSQVEPDTADCCPAAELRWTQASFRTLVSVSQRQHPGCCNHPGGLGRSACVCCRGWRARVAAL